MRSEKLMLIVLGDPVVRNMPKQKGASAGSHDDLPVFLTINTEIP
jgi:hypothetical protein